MFNLLPPAQEHNYRLCELILFHHTSGSHNQWSWIKNFAFYYHLIFAIYASSKTFYPSNGIYFEGIKAHFLKLSVLYFYIKKALLFSTKYLHHWLNINHKKNLTITFWNLRALLWHQQLLEMWKQQFFIHFV